MSRLLKASGAYHGSPYSFDEFSTSQIGTGEGAQAFGYGLYFAEEEPVAKAYRDALKGRMVTTSDGVTKTYGKHITEVEDAIRAAHPNLNPDNIRAAAKSVVDDNLTDADVEGMGQWEGVYKSGIVANKNAQASKGSMYEVKIDAAAEDFLNWQTPLREQKKLLSALDDQYGDHEIVLQQLGLDIKNETPTGGDLAMALGMTRGGQTAPPRLLTDAGLKGVKYPAAFTRQKSPDKQSFNYVIFDDRLISISKKYGISIPAAAAIAAGTMTPEEAQAGPLSAGARRIIDPRFSGPVGSGSKRKGVLTDLEGMETTIDPRLMNIGRSEALYDYEGSPYILTQSDRSAAGGVITSVKGKEIDPVNLRGGRDFMFDPESEGLVWASDPSVVKSMYKRALELREKYKKDPLLLPYTMAPTGIDFATMPLDVMINYARKGMGRSDIKRLDEQIRKVIPSWKGVMNPEANAVFREVHGNKRKAVANIIDKQFRDVEGGLSIGEARAATSDAAQYMAPDGSIQNIGQIEISNTSSRDQLSDHPTYRGGLKGQGIGKLDVDIDARELMEGKGRELTGDAADIRALSMNHEFSQGVIDEKLLRRLYDKQRPRIEAISEKFGVSIPIAAMALMAGPEEAQAGMGGMGVRSAPTAEDEEAMLAAQPPAPTGGDLLRQANDEFMGGIMTEPRSYMGDIEQALLGGIMQTAGMADLAADVFSSLAAPVMSAPGAIGRYVADRYIPGVNYSAEDIARERKATEDYFNYQPRTDLGQQYGEQAAQTIGGVIGPYLPAIKEAAGDSYILGAMRKGYDYLGDKEKELAKAMLDLSPI
jgi:hypothetical protein